MDHDADPLPDARDEDFDYAETLRRERLEVSAPNPLWFVVAGVMLLLTLILLAT